MGRRNTTLSWKMYYVKTVDVFQNIDNTENKIEQCLKKNGIDCGNSHGGLFEGVSCLKEEKNIDSIIEEIKTILIDEGDDVEEIQTIFSSFRIHFISVSHTISLIRTERNEMHEGVIQQLREVCR